ncbi:ABC transporter permease subunit [Candidatus Allofournierella merdipullorum]|uniref:ABC transporter permease subunit n=1 Tax=Candidatus Allofournierella merdipullorum TaxID=2838595 RepID=UPI00374F52AE
MNKLLWANWARLRHYKAFWLTLTGVFLVSLLSIWSGSRAAEQLAQSGFARTLDSYYFALATFLGGLYAVFFSLFLSAEFSDGTVRNKLVVGHSRIRIYLADYLICLAACLVFAAVWLLGGLPGLLWMGPFSMGLAEFFAYLLVIIGFTAAFAALFALVNLLPANKAVTVVLSLAVWLGLVLTASAFYDRLSEPEMISGVVYADGAFQEMEPHPNPMYLAGAVRTACTWALEFLPAGQAQLVRGVEVDSPLRMLAFSALFTALALLAGACIFQKKDLK